MTKQPPPSSPVPPLADVLDAGANANGQTIYNVGRLLLAVTTGAGSPFMLGPMPTTDPGQAGAVWVDAANGNILRVSAG